MKKSHVRRGRRGLRSKPSAVAKCDRRSRVDAHPEDERFQQLQPNCEAGFRALTEEIPQLIWTCDPEGQCDYASPQWGEYTGIPPGKLLGKGWLDIVHLEDQPQMWGRYNAAKAKGQNFALEYRLRNARGEYRWFKVAALPVCDAEGKVTKWFGTCTDIDDQKNHAVRLEQRVKERTAALTQTITELQNAIFERRCAEMARDRLAAIVECSEDAILSKDLDGIIRSWNASAEKLFGYRAEEAIGQSIALIIPLEKRAEEAMIRERVGLGERVEHLETSRLTKDGRRVEVFQTGSPVRDASGAVIGVSLIIRNISERKAAERALRQSEARKAAILESAMDCIITIDKEGRIVEVNPAVEKTFGYTPQEMLGKEMAELIIPPGLRNSCRRGFARYLKTGQGPLLGRRTELSACRKDGSEFTAELDVCALSSDGQSLFTGTLRDISDRKRAEEALRQARGELEARVRDRTADLAKANEALRNSERRLGILAAATFEGIAITENGLLVDANEQLQRLLGYTREELLGTRVEAHLPANEVGRVLPNILAGRESDLEHEMIRKDGTRLLVEAHGQTVNVDGRSVRFTAIRDVTERRRIEEVLRDSEQRFRTLAESLPNVVWTATADGQLDYVNNQWHAYTGLPHSAAFGSSWTEAIHPDDRAVALACWLQAVATGTPYDCDRRLRSADGTYRWYKDRGMPLRNQAGQILKWFGTCTDIHEHKNYAAQLEQTVEERTARLRQALEELETFSYSIAHDMRAPLRAMQSFAGVLIGQYTSKLEPRGIDYVLRIRNAANRLDRLIQDVLSYTRVVRGTVHMERVNTDKLIHDLLAGQPEWQLPKAEVTLEEPLPAVWANEAYLTQAISNLLTNAVKFVAEGTVPRVRVKAESAGKDVRIWIEDNGIGIASEDQERIFKLLDRVHPETEYEGTGLGLAIVRKACERMNGQVGVESQPGQGSRFWIQLKAAQ